MIETDELEATPAPLTPGDDVLFRIDQEPVQVAGADCEWEPPPRSRRACRSSAAALGWLGGTRRRRDHLIEALASTRS
mgnify:CR=1 FL=1